MISGKQSQLISSKVDPNMPDGRTPTSLLASIRPQRMRYQNGRDSAGLALFPDFHDMLVLPSRSLVPGPFPSSFKTGTTLPPPADPSFMVGGRYGSPPPLETAFQGEHVVLLL